MNRPKMILPATLLLLSLSFYGTAFSQANEDCLACHEDKELKGESGKAVFVDNEQYLASSHGQAEVSCIDCHADLAKVKDFPHASPLKAVNCSRCHDAAALEFQKSVHSAVKGQGEGVLQVGCKDCHGTHEIKGKDAFDSMIFPLNLPATCEACHLDKVKAKKGLDFVRGYRESVHFKALEKSGLTMSANCGNCHGSHDIRRVEDPAALVARKNIIATCGSCHVGIQRDYLEGVHGKDYVKGIKDVPVCTDCHSEHDILSPQDLKSKVYATKVAGVCARCHDNLAMSRQYGFMTSRLKTYNESFHGTASRFGETRVANCASCHGFHDIRSSDDPKSSINAANLPKTCGRCHPGASRHFAEGQIHAVAEASAVPKYQTSTLVKNIYVVMISVIISVMIIFIIVDFIRRLVKKENHG